MVSHPRAEIATVKIGHLEFEGLMLEDGTFGIGVPQICNLFRTHKNYASQQFKRLLGDAFRPHKISTTLGNQKINVIDLKTFELLVAKLDRSGNEYAQVFRDMLVGLSLHQLFSDAFLVKFEKDDRQKWLKARQEGKVTRRTLTDAIKEYLDTHECSATYRKYIYSNVTDAINLAIFNRRAAKLKEDWNTVNPRDAMQPEELRLVEHTEALAMRLMDADSLEPMAAVHEAIARLCLPKVSR